MELILGLRQEPITRLLFAAAVVVRITLQHFCGWNFAFKLCDILMDHFWQLETTRWFCSQLYQLAGFTEKQKRRDRRRFEHADANRDSLLSRDELISLFHPEESANMFGVIVEVWSCAWKVLIWVIFWPIWWYAWHFFLQNYKPKTKFMLKGVSFLRNCGAVCRWGSIAR